MFPKFMVYVPNTIETFSCLREAQKILLGKTGMDSIDGINIRFMSRFMEMHSELEASVARRLRPSGASGTRSMTAAAAALASARPELASAGARSTWLSQRPYQARNWEVTPHSCQVVQGRRAEHQERDWLQVTVRLTAEERWQGRDGNPDSRLLEHFVVYELPRAGGVHDFRVALIRPDTGPV